MAAPIKNSTFNSLCSLRINIAKMIPYIGSILMTRFEAKADKCLRTLSESAYAKVVHKMARISK